MPDRNIDTTRRWILWIGGVIVAVAVAVIIVFATQTDDLRAGCERNSERAALNAFGWKDVGDARAARGEDEAARRSYALSEGVSAKIPSPNGADHREVIEVTMAERNGKKWYAVTDNAKRLQKQGCEEAFPGLPIVNR